MRLSQRSSPSARGPAAAVTTQGGYSHPEPQNQGGRAGRDLRSSAREADAAKGSTCEAQRGYKTITTSCPSPGDAEGWARQVAGRALPLALGVPRPSALWTMRAGYNGVN